MRTRRALALLLVAPFGLVGCLTSHSDGIVVDGADLAEPGVFLDPLPSPNTREAELLPTRGHHIAAGRHRVIGYRTWNAGDFLTIDDESYEKITIVLPDEFSGGDSGSLRLGDSPQATIVYTRGGSAWPDAACFGAASAGHVSYARGSLGGWNVEVEIEAALRNPLWDCPSVRLSRRFHARARSLESLTPWLGRPGDGSPYAETYPGDD